MSNCGCGSQSQVPVVSICDPCNTNTGCQIQLDWDCLIYHKSNNQVTQLDCLALTNGATLTQFAEAVDSYICQLKVADYNLPCLRADYTINSLKQLAEAIDIEICQIKSDIDNLESLVNLPITPVDTQSINLTVSGTNAHTIQADVIVSPQAGNQLSTLVNGLFSAPQTLSVNYTTKELSISDGNTVSLAGLACGVGGFLGNIASDPGAALDGQYWYNTTTSQLKIRLSNATRIITIT